MNKEELEEYVRKLEKENESLKQENDFLKQMYRGTEEYKAISRFADGR